MYKHSYAADNVSLKIMISKRKTIIRFEKTYKCTVKATLKQFRKLPAANNFFFHINSFIYVRKCIGLYDFSR